MRTLVIFKRIEIWLLLVVVVGLLVVAFSPDSQPEVSEPGAVVVLSDENDSLVPEVPVEPEREVLVVDDVFVVPQEQGRIVEVTLSGRTPDGDEAYLDASTVKATIEGGEPVNFFFEPFHRPVVLTGDEDSLVTVKLWLEEPVEVVWLEFQGEMLKAELPH